MEIEDAMLEILQQLGEIGNHAVEIDLALVEAVEMAGPQHQLVGRRTQGLEARSRPRLTVKLIGAADEQRLDAAPPAPLLMQVMGEDLGAAGMQPRIVLADGEKLEAAHVASAEIGRASCRDRVCKSGLNWVGGVI